MLELGEKNETEFKDIKVKKKDATLGQTRGERRSKGCKMKTLAKVQERTEQLLGYRVDKVRICIVETCIYQLGLLLIIIHVRNC